MRRIWILLILVGLVTEAQAGLFDLFSGGCPGGVCPMPGAQVAQSRVRIRSRQRFSGNAIPQSVPQSYAAAPQAYGDGGGCYSSQANSPASYAIAPPVTYSVAPPATYSVAPPVQAPSIYASPQLPQAAPPSKSSEYVPTEGSPGVRGRVRKAPPKRRMAVIERRPTVMVHRPEITVGDRVSYESMDSKDPIYLVEGK